jgi:uncharacterized phage infection (PIP) family protein YhgE
MQLVVFSRRQALLNGGIALITALAGCSDGSSNQETEQETDTPTSTPEPETEESEDTPTQTEEPDTETESEPEAEEEEVNEERQEALEKIESAKDILEEGLQMYIEFDSENEDILDVTSMDGDFKYTDVVNHIRDAKEDLDDAKEFGISDFTGRIESLQNEYELIDGIARTQGEGQSTKREAENYADRTSNSDPNVSQLDDLVDDVRSNNDTFANQISEARDIVEQTSEFEIRTNNLYSNKIEQLQSERDIFSTYTEMYSDYKRGIEDLNDAKDREEDEEAEFVARNAQDWFERCLNSLNDTNDQLLGEITEIFEENLNYHIEEAQDVIDEARGF